MVVSQQVLFHKAGSSTMIHRSKLPTGKQVLYEYEVRSSASGSEQYRDGADITDNSNNSGNNEVSVVRGTSYDVDSHLFLTGEKKVSVSVITTGLYPRRCRVFLVNPVSPRNRPNLTTVESITCHRPDKTVDMRLELLGDTSEVADVLETNSRFAEAYTVRGHNTGLQATLYSLRVSSGGRTVLLPLTSVR